jgi:hypothetical protein
VLFSICVGDVASEPDGCLDFGVNSVPNAVFYSVENFRGKLRAVFDRFESWGDSPSSRNLIQYLFW